MRALTRAPAWVGWAILGALALAGLALSTVAFLAAVPFTRPFVASVAVRFVDEAIAGRIVLAGVSLLPHGDLELRGVEVYDPDGHLVLSVGKARVSVDVTELRARAVGLAVELDAPTVVVEQEADGGTSLARAFAPSRPAAPRPAAGPVEGEEGGAWTVHLSRLELRGGELWWKDAAGATRAEAAGIDVSARATLGPRRARAEVRLSAQLRTPLATPLSLELVVRRAGDAVRVPVLRLEAGGTALDAVAEGDLARRSGRVAVRRVAVSRAEARALVPGAPAGADLAAAGYAESDGATLTAALRVEPAGEGRAGGQGDVALAARLDALRRAAGFDVALERLDPSRMAAALPSGEVTLSARGALAGASLEDLRARLALTASRSRLGRGELTRAEVALRVARGTVDLDRLTAAIPGAKVDASGRWRRGGTVSGTATVDASDLAAAARNGALLAGARPPAVAGRARVEATISGTSAAPLLAGRLDAPALRSGALGVEGVHLAVRLAGPRASPSGQVEGRIASIRDGAIERARQVALKAGLVGSDGSLSARAFVPGVGTDPVAVDARVVLDRGRDQLEIRQLAVAYPGSRWALVRPATVDLRAPAVDRLALQDPPQSLAVEGGVGPRGELSLRVELSHLDLARLPVGILPRAGLRGEVSGEVAATGMPGRPDLAGRISVEHGGYGRLGSLSLAVDGRWDGTARRASGSASVLRAEGGSVDAQVELPVPLAGRGREPVRVRLRAAALPIPELLATAGRDLPARGKLGVTLDVGGTAAAPSAAAEITVVEGAWQDLEGLGATVAVEAPGATAHVVASGLVAGRRVAAVEASAPLDLGDLVERPSETLRALGRAQLHATASILALDLAALSGRVGTPRDLAGIVEGHAEVTGTPAAPRGSATLAVTGAAYGAWRELGATLDASAAESGLAATGGITIQGEEALRLRATLAIRPERLGDRTALAAAPLRVDAEVPRIALRRAAGQALPLEGTLEGHVSVVGTPRAPELRADLAGTGMAVKGHPLGDAKASARYARGRGEGELALSPPSGGTLRATAALTAEVGLGVRGPSLADAPAEVRVVAEGLDLGFVPAVAPGIVRTAAGKVEMDVRAAGPLLRMSPRGTLHVAGGRFAVVELGEWTDVAIDARLTEDDVELSRFDVRRGHGTFSAKAAVRGLRSESARVSASVAASGFSIARAGMELATLDLDGAATGTWTPSSRELSLEVSLPRETVRLPRRTPRALQSLDDRKDIVVGRRAEQREAPRPASAGGAAAAKSFTVRVHAVAPGKLFVKSDDPKIDVELKADVRYEREEGENYVSGSVQVVRGNVEPIGGRNFTIEHGAVRFTNGPPDAALLDIQAKYVNPAATVTAKVTGTIHSPDLKLISSVPQMTDADIALLLLTGRTQAKAGSGGVGSVTGEEAGMAVVGVLATQAFKNLVQNKLPLDTVALDAGGFRAGKYVTDRIYVGYVRRWDADPTKFENADEVRVEYQISTRWSFESRYGNAQSGGANLVWSKDY